MSNQRGYKIYQEIHRRKIVRLVLLRAAAAILLVISLGLAIYQYYPAFKPMGKAHFSRTADVKGQLSVPSGQISAIDLGTAVNTDNSSAAQEIEVAITQDTLELLQDPCNFRPEVQ